LWVDEKEILALRRRVRGDAGKTGTTIQAGEGQYVEMRTAMIRRLAGGD